MLFAVLAYQPVPAHRREPRLGAWRLSALSSADGVLHAEFGIKFCTRPRWPPNALWANVIRPQGGAFAVPVQLGRQVGFGRSESSARYGSVKHVREGALIENLLCD
ncbi:hypothetical protein D9M68_807490 [compost metagenome]